PWQRPLASPVATDPAAVAAGPAAESPGAGRAVGLPALRAAVLGAAAGRRHRQRGGRRAGHAGIRAGDPGAGGQHRRLRRPDQPPATEAGETPGRRHEPRRGHAVFLARAGGTPYRHAGFTRRGTPSPSLTADQVSSAPRFLPAQVTPWTSPFPTRSTPSRRTFCWMRWKASATSPMAGCWP